MKHLLLVLPLCLGLVACKEDNKKPVQAKSQTELFPTLATGTYNISMETEQELPSAGKYYSGRDGNKVVVINDEDDRAQIVMSYDAKTKQWQSNQADKNRKIKFSNVSKIEAQKLNINSLTGSYMLSLQDDSRIAMEIQPQGRLISKDKNCQFSGVITESDLDNVAKYQLEKNSCDALKNNNQGYILVDEDLEPASFRLVSDRENAKDLRGFSLD